MSPAYINKPFSVRLSLSLGHGSYSALACADRSAPWSSPPSWASTHTHTPDAAQYFIESAQVLVSL